MSKPDKTLSKPVVYVLIALVILSSIFAIMMFGPGTGPTNSLFKSTLRYYTKGTEELYYADYAKDIIQDIREIGIDVTSLPSEYSIFLDEVYGAKEYDMAVVEFEGLNSPHLDLLFKEGATDNIFNFENSMDGNVTLNLINNITVETDFNARKALLYQLQEHIMTNVLPMIPLFTPVRAYAYWDNIEGFTSTIGISQSLPYMTFNGLHDSQSSTNELFIGSGKWFDLNPLSMSEDAEKLIVSFMMDKLIQLDDKGMATKYGLIDNWEYLNDTTLLLHVRDNVRWQPDIDGLFPTETLSTSDVLFTLDMYTNQEANINADLFNWIDSYEEYNSSTVAIYIDSFPSTPEKDPYAFAVEDLSIYPFPAYYLDVAPTIHEILTSNRWTKFSDDPFGTGKYIYNSTESQVDLAAVLHKFGNWHGIGVLPGQTTNLAFNTIEVQMYGDSYSMHLALQEGRIDLADFKKNPIIEDAIPDEGFKVEFKIENSLIFLAFNLQNEIFGGENNYLPTNETGVSKALAIRKAIAFSLQKSLTNSRLHNGHYNITDTPIPTYYQDYYYKGVTKYTYDLNQAVNYLILAGFNISTGTQTEETSFSFMSSMISVGVISPILVLIINRRKNKVKIND